MTRDRPLHLQMSLYDALVKMLSGMNGDQVGTIEIINSPPAQYDAEGNAGLINILSMENLEMGTNGSF